MATAKAILSELQKKGSEKTRATLARHGLPADRMYGVSIADLKMIAKNIKGEQALACELYATGNVDAMYLAGLVANGAQLTKPDLEKWATGAIGMPMISEYTVPWVAIENASAREVALVWMKSKEENIAAAGWCTYAGLVATKVDADLDLAEIDKLLTTVVREIGGAKGRAKLAMNSFVIAVGTYVKPLLKQAKAAAQKIGEVSVDMGDTACKISLASASIAKAEASGKLGKKKKTMRC
jgi:3-methyladenine DNA glycosylase AlkD